MKKHFMLFLSIGSMVTLLFAQKVEITSLKMNATEMSKEIHFIGDAKVVQEKDYIYADEIVVFFDENNQTKRYDAIGNVRFEIYQNNAHYKGKADKVSYFPLKMIYILEGNAVVDDLNEKRHIRATKITLNSKTGDAQVNGNRKKPVKFIFETEQKK